MKKVLKYLFLLSFYGCISGSYVPGLLKDNVNLNPPVPNLSSSEYFHVEHGVFLKQEVQYSGTNIKDAPVILVVHGGPCLPMEKPWDSLNDVSKKYRVVYYHQRGCGDSTKPEMIFGPNYLTNKDLLVDTLGLSVQISDIERIRRILKVQKMTIMAHSFGALLGSLYAAEFPERIEKMILIGPADVIKMPAEHDFFDILEEHLSEDDQDLYSDYRDRSMSFFSFLKIFGRTEEFHRNQRLEFFDFYKRALLHSKNIIMPSVNNPEELGGWMPNAIFISMGMSHDYTDALKVVKAPVHVLHGQNDLMLEVDSVKFANYFENGHFHLVPKTTHFAYMENPEYFSDLMKEIL